MYLLFLYIHHTCTHVHQFWIHVHKRLEYKIRIMDNKPVIDESGSFRSPKLEDDTDSYGTQDSGEFGTIPADKGIFDDMRDDFSGRARNYG